MGLFLLCLARPGGEVALTPGPLLCWAGQTRPAELSGCCENGASVGPSFLGEKGYGGLPLLTNLMEHRPQSQEEEDAGLR
jgi:hypothetical protein